MKLTRYLVHLGKYQNMEIPITPAQYQACMLKFKSGMLSSQAFPMLTHEQLDFIFIGHARCETRFFSPSEEDREDEEYRGRTVEDWQDFCPSSDD